MKTYVITVSREFPKTHKRAGQDTEFFEKLACSLFCPGPSMQCEGCEKDPAIFKKIHTIRQNYDLWEKRIKEVQAGRAILSIRSCSRQVKLVDLDEGHGVGIQKLEFLNADLKFQVYTESPTLPSIKHLANNDGLSFDDFKEWFKGCDLSKPLAIIHFTQLRY